MWRSSRGTSSLRAPWQGLLGCLLLAAAAAGSADQYVFPVEPSSSASFSQGGHPYPAIDIFAPRDSWFVAPTGGVVEAINDVDRYDPKQVDPNAKGGIWVSMVGTDGIRYYGSHLEALAPGLRVGMPVEPGQRLGRLGTTGNARGTPRHLHFGLSDARRPLDWKTRRGEIDPYPFLACLTRGGCDPFGEVSKPLTADE